MVRLFLIKFYDRNKFFNFLGTERIKSDFEFMLGHILSNIWLLLWWLLPILLIGIFAWALVTLPFEDTFVDDPLWMIGAGWGLVLTALIFIFVVGFWSVSRQDGYTFADVSCTTKNCKCLNFEPLSGDGKGAMSIFLLYYLSQPPSIYPNQTIFFSTDV